MPVIAIAIVMAGTMAVGAGCGGDDPMVRRIAQLTPAALAPQRAEHQEATHTARLRVYATPQYQAQNMQWRQRFSDELDAVNQYLIPAFGVRLVVAEYASWAHDDDARPLEAMLDALEKHDPARDVDWVIGLASALSSTTNRFHDLGVARVLGRHMILRGFEDMALEPALAMIDEAPRERLREGRRQHRQATTFLHEWAHTLGAMHVPDADAIMAAEYTREIRTFGAQTEALLQRMIPVRLAPPAERSPAGRSIIAEARALQKYLEAVPARPGQEQERAEMLEMLAAMLAEAPAEAAPGAETPEAESGHHAAGQVPAEVREEYTRVQALHRQGQHAQARAGLDELIAAYPAHLEFRLAACRMRLDEAGPTEEARATCGRVAAIAPTEIDGEIMVVSALIQAGRQAEAGAALAAVRERLASLPAPAPGQAATPVVTAWQRLLSGLMALEAVTWTEQAVAAAPAGVDTAAASAWATQLRRRYGLPPDSARRHGITPEAEGAYLVAVREALAQVYRGEHAAAERTARQALARHRDAPGLHGALCDLELRRKRSAAARTHCQKALATYEQASWSHYLMGILELQSRKNASGIRHLERAIELDPDLRQAYHALHQAHGRAKDRAAQERVNGAYQQRFGQSLPPR
jgi:tetratricopeptide (TPR) repeat protein